MIFKHGQIRLVDTFNYNLCTWFCSAIYMQIDIKQVTESITNGGWLRVEKFQ